MSRNLNNCKNLLNKSFHEGDIWKVLKQKQEFRRIVLCHQLWLKTEVDEIQKDKNYDGHK